MVRNCGPNKWRMTTLETIEASDTITKRINTSIEDGKKCDPLPTLREQEQDFEFARRFRVFIDAREIL